MNKDSFQIAIIGGGINGAGVAREAAYRGYSTLLLEKEDFASGTSSQSSKLIHGGVRYLEQGHLHLVWEALHERRILHEIAPHLVHPLRLQIPIYQGDSRAPWKIRAGLKLYDLLAGRHNLEPSETVPRNQWRDFPGLNKQNLQALVHYSDGQTDDSRLVLENVISAEEAGAVVHNYTKVLSVEKSAAGFLLRCQDKRTGQIKVFLAQALVNAAGPWAAELDKGITETAKRPGLCFSKGIHLVIPKRQEHHAFLTLPADGRVVFVLPWKQHYLLIGTTETPYQSPASTQIPSDPAEEEYLKQVFMHYFPGPVIQEQEIVHRYAGLRCLIDRGESSLGKMSREPEILEEKLQSGHYYYALFGGKLTSYRIHAERLLAKIQKHLPPKKAALGLTSVRPLPGAEPIAEWEEAKAYELAKSLGIGEYQILHWKRHYGTRWVRLVALLPEFNERAFPGGPQLAELRYQIETEKAWELEDVILRRTKWGYELGQEAQGRLLEALYNLREKLRQG